MRGNVNPRDDQVDTTAIEDAELTPIWDMMPQTLAREKLQGGWQGINVPSGAPVMPKRTSGTRGAVDQVADHLIAQRVNNG